MKHSKKSNRNPALIAVIGGLVAIITLLAYAPATGAQVVAPAPTPFEFTEERFCITDATGLCSIEHGLGTMPYTVNHNGVQRFATLNDPFVVIERRDLRSDTQVWFMVYSVNDGRPLTNTWKLLNLIMTAPPQQQPPPTTT